MVLLAGTQPAGATRTATRYQVQRGESIGDIAVKLGVNASALAQFNSLADPDLVYAGSWLRVPETGSSVDNSRKTRSNRSPRTHTVTRGETLSGIAAQYGLATSTVAQANAITNPHLVIAGRRLQIPAGGRSTDRSSVPSTNSSEAIASTSGKLPLRLRNSPSRLALMPTFDRWSAASGAPADLVKAVTWLESGWQQDVVSSTGAVGIGQLMPSTVVTMNQVLGTNLSATRADENIRMSARYIAFLLDATGGDSARALAGYYQGLASVDRNGLYPSTLAYVEGVIALRARFR